MSMKVFFITSDFLDANGGGSFASRAFANAFAEIAQECVLMYPDRGKSVKEFLHTKCMLEGVPNNKGKLHKLIDIYTGRIHRFTKKAINKIIAFSPDIVVFDTSHCSAGIIKFVKQRNIKVITIHHNYEMEYYRGTPPCILWRIPFMYYMKKTEKNAVIFSDLNLTLTNQDAVLLKDNYAKAIDLNIATLGCFESKILSLSTKVNQCISSKLRFVITGSLSSYQTEVSLIPFLKDIYPKLVELYPKSELIIAGKEPSENIKMVCKRFPTITLIPNPDNMQEIIAQSDIYICPTCVGGGLKLRIMDGFKGGLPVITHQVSARGYDAFFENGCMFVYYDQVSFIREIEKLVEKLKNNELSSHQIIEIYDKYFSFQSGVKRLKNILNTKQDIIH